MKTVLSFLIVLLALTVQAQKADSLIGDIKTVDSFIALENWHIATLKEIEDEKKQILSAFDIRTRTLYEFVLKSKGVDVKQLMSARIEGDTLKYSLPAPKPPDKKKK